MMSAPKNHFLLILLSIIHVIESNRLAGGHLLFCLLYIYINNNNRYSFIEEVKSVEHGL
jgi:hypothetical protein